MKPLDALSGQAVNKMVASRMEDAEAQRSCQSTKKLGLEGLYYERKFRPDGAVKCSVLETLKLTDAEMLTRKVVRNEVTWFDAARRAAIGSLN